jgi:hypothetical protein
MYLFRNKISVKKTTFLFVRVLVEGSCEHGNEPSGSINCWEFLSNCTPGGFSRRAQFHEVSYLFTAWRDWFKINVKLPLCLIQHHHESGWGSGGTTPPFLTLALDGGEWSASRSGRYFHSIGGWVVPRAAGLDATEKRKSLPLPWIEPRFLNRPSSSTVLTEICQVLGVEVRLRIIPRDSVPMMTLTEICPFPQSLRWRLGRYLETDHGHLLPNV